MNNLQVNRWCDNQSESGSGDDTKSADGRHDEVEARHTEQSHERRGHRVELVEERVVLRQARTEPGNRINA